MAPRPKRSADKPDVPAEPSDAEIDAWASRERQRRERWLLGPTQEQASVLASRAGEELESAGGPGRPRAQLAQYSLRTAQLAAEGAISLLLRASVRDVLELLVQAGREWEDEFQ